MAKKGNKAGAAKAGASGKPAKSAAGVRAEKTPPIPAENSASERFVNDLLVRGEAVPAKPGQRLPLGATHVIKKQNKDGSVSVQRVRFKMV